jgi:hypothetical protein
MKVIKKFNQLHLDKVYYQVNFIKGYRYIDKAGEILNSYQTEDGRLSYDINADRLIIRNVFNEKTLAELKIATTDFWCHFDQPSNFGTATRVFIEEATKTLGIVEVDNLTRVGVRAQYILETGENVENIGNIGSGENKIPVRAAAGKYKLDDSVDSTVRVERVKHAKKGTEAILFDVDVSVDQSIKVDDLSNTLKLLVDHVRSDDLLEKINGVIKEL